ncbi:hypothetical protein CAC42_7434 [Sphaceloma murrayae]|uniref:RRM domain-containing protein n=1 Tax=Sphaceloma murrayae TaxID=2082308 RepID=A0A2K1QX88_9PEZI|nr:hypothetical protein CAC42_7434 [Sphaceloma murrayae]
MSDTEVLSGKAKKAKRSEERFKKSKKRKRDTQAEEVVQDADKSGEQGAGPEETQKKEAVMKTTSRKRKTGEQDESAPGDPEQASQTRKKRKQDDANAEAGSNDAAESKQPSKHRYICFIGNLPYSATDATIAEHFKAITPTSIRHRTDPKTKKSKGFAFLEFDAYDRMKTCLKLYHHSMFDSGKPNDKGRRINVELTAGGGGKGEQRKKKLGEKNTRLEDQRKRRAEALAKQEKRKEGKGKTEGKNDGGGARSKRTPAIDQDGGMESVDASEGVHPARLAMMNKSR